MSALSQSRDDLAETLKTTGITVYDYRPESLDAPCYVIEPDDPYVTDEGQPFDSLRVNYTITLVADVGTNEKATADLDDLITALIDTELAVGEIGKPVQFNYNTANYLGAVATYHDRIKIGD